MKIQTPLLLLVFLLFYTTGTAQTQSEQELMKLSYDSLISLFDAHDKDTLFARKVCYSYLKKARKDNDSVKMARAHERLSLVCDYEQAIFHVDSTIYLTRNSTHKNYPTAGHLKKARYLFYLERFEESIDNAILGYQSAVKKNNIIFQIGGLHGISINNDIWGETKKSLEIELKALKLAKRTKYYGSKKMLAAAHSSIGTSHVRLRQPDSAIFHYRKAINFALESNDIRKYHDILGRCGAALYFKGNLKAAKDSLIKSYENGIYLSELGYTCYPYYMGRIAMDQGDKETGINYFKKIDSTYSSDNILYPELTFVYHTLTKEAKEKKQLEQQLLYLNQLFKIDSLLDERNKYVKEKTTKGYDIPLLLKEKEIIIDTLNAKNKTSNKTTWIAFSLLFVCMLIALYHFRKQRVYKKRFKQLIQSQKESKSTEPIINASQKKNAKEIPGDILAEILKELQKFEAEKRYLQPNIKLKELAKELKTNSSYLSKAINEQKAMNFANYINKLRADYGAQWLLEDKKARMYTIKAVAQECGFSTAESFSKAFFKSHGIYPSYYIKQLKKDN